MEVFGTEFEDAEMENFHMENLDAADAFADSTMFEGTWRSASVNGATEVAKGFYETFLPRKNIDRYFEMISKGKIMINVHAQGPNILKSERYYRGENGVMLIGEEQTVDLTEGTMDPLCGVGKAKVDLHWNTDHSSIVGIGNIPGGGEFSYCQKIDNGDNLLKTFTIGTKSWEILFNRASADGFANTGMYEGAWKSDSIKGDTKTAKDFYEKFLPGKNIGQYFTRINRGRITCNIHAPGSNMLMYHEFGPHGRIGPKLTLNLTKGTMEPVAGFAEVDLHWNRDHTAIIGWGTVLRGNNQKFSTCQKLSDDGQTLLREFNLGDNSWEKVGKKVANKVGQLGKIGKTIGNAVDKILDRSWTVSFKKDHGFLGTKSFEGTWQSVEITGAIDAAKTFYTSLLPDKDIDKFFGLINGKKMMNSIHATGLNTFTRETFYLDDDCFTIECGDIEKISLVKGNPSLYPVQGENDAEIDLHWDECHSAIVGSGKVPGITGEVSARQELVGDNLVRTYTLGKDTWTIIWKKQ